MARAEWRTLLWGGLLALLQASDPRGLAQVSPELQQFFQRDAALSQDEIHAINQGQAIAKEMPSRKPDEVFLLGAIYVRASPESYLKFATDFERMRTLPGTLAFGTFSEPPKLADVRGFAFDDDDLSAIKNCRPGNCLIQMPGTAMAELQQSIDWSSPAAGERVNGLLRRAVVERLLTYQREGNLALGTYDDKKHSTDVAAQFAYMLSYSKALPAYLPEFYNYLLAYPNAKPANVDDAFYWARVKFGLKPTLRVVHMLVRHGADKESVAYAIAQKQLYASHYFETALDLSFCIRPKNPQERGFYLVMALASEQKGLSGFKGSVVRDAAVGRSLDRLKNSLVFIKNQLERRR
jgi:hypothetical protein